MYNILLVYKYKYSFDYQKSPASCLSFNRFHAGSLINYSLDIPNTLLKSFGLKYSSFFDKFMLLLIIKLSPEFLPSF